MRAALIGLAASVILSAGCDNMQHQENVRAFEPSRATRDESSARLPPAHTAAWSTRTEGAGFLSGRQSGRWLERSPIRLTRELVERGAGRYGIFCVECHGGDGAGGGIVVLRGYPRPRPFSDLAGEPLGEIFAAIGSGTGPMFGYADRISAEDRWAVSAYVRALGLSARASIGDVPDEERRKLEAE